MAAPNAGYRDEYTCPNGCDLRDAEIPQEYRDKGWYGDSTHYSRLIGITDPALDRTVEWLCPDCGVRWDQAPIDSDAR